MLIDILITIAGLGLLVISGDALVRGASDLANNFGVSKLVIGLTIVSLGTSAPELGVNVIAAIQDNTDLSYGNILGSNIANIALILGVTALISPIQMHGTLVVRDIPIMVIATIGTFVASSDVYLDQGPVNVVSRTDGLLLLGYCFFFTFIVLHAARRERKDALRIDYEEVMDEDINPHKLLSVPLASLLTILGIAGVVGGGQLTVIGSVSIAESLGISQTVIGLTVVAIGTSLPELVTCVMAALRGHADLAAGNVIGSNIYNLLLILAVTSGITPITVPEGGMIDLGMVMVLSLALIPMAITSSQKITRSEGTLLLISYFGYIGWRVYDAIN